MKICTWNVNSVRARREILLGFLAREQPDVVCLQETKVIDEDFPSVDLLRAGYRSCHRGQRGYNGVGILTKKTAPENVVIAYGDGEPDEQARLIAATYGGIHVICVYVPNGGGVGTESYHDKLRWLGRLRAFLDKHYTKKDKVVLCGDFNVAPEDRDTYSPARFENALMCTELERKALARLVDWGLTDAYRKFHPEAGHFTWWDYRMGQFQKDQGFRIDHMYVSPALVSACTAATIDKSVRGLESPSDHAPVILTLKTRE